MLIHQMVLQMVSPGITDATVLASVAGTQRNDRTSRWRLLVVSRRSCVELKKIIFELIQSS